MPAEFNRRSLNQAIEAFGDQRCQNSIDDQYKPNTIQFRPHVNHGKQYSPVSRNLLK